VIDSCTFDQYNLKLVNFDSIFQSIEVDFINDLETYNLLSFKKINRDIKKLLYHHIFFGISEHLLKHSTKERIVILKKSDGSLTDNLQSFIYLQRNDLQAHIDQAVHRVAKLLPINIYGYIGFNFIDIEKLYREGNGDVVELIERIKTYSWKRNFVRNTYTFARVKSFAKRNNLTFLSEEYFNQLKTKQLLFI
jgi:hypothetical protein